MTDKSIAHQRDMNHFGAAKWPDGLVEWSPATAPDLAAPYPVSQYRTTGRLRHCGYCGSMHPADVAAAINAGARMHWADQKYGWPHKVYVDGIPNPHAGMLESRHGSSHATPFCPKKGAPCEHGNQSSHRSPESCCMAQCPEQVVTGTTDSGAAVFLKQTGFDQRTGKPEYSWRGAAEPARATTDGKFYSVHLQDASPEDRAVVERAMGRSFLWREGKMWYGPFHEGGLIWEVVEKALAAQGQQA